MNKNKIKAFLATLIATGTLGMNISTVDAQEFQDVIPIEETIDSTSEEGNRLECSIILENEDGTSSEESVIADSLNEAINIARENGSTKVKIRLPRQFVIDESTDITGVDVEITGTEEGSEMYRAFDYSDGNDSLFIVKDNDESARPSSLKINNVVFYEESTNTQCSTVKNEGTEDVRVEFQNIGANYLGFSNCNTTVTDSLISGNINLSQNDTFKGQNSYFKMLCFNEAKSVELDDCEIGIMSGEAKRALIQNSVFDNNGVIYRGDKVLFDNCVFLNNLGANHIKFIGFKNCKFNKDLKINGCGNAQVSNTLLNNLNHECGYQITEDSEEPGLNNDEDEDSEKTVNKSIGRIGINNCKVTGYMKFKNSNARICYTNIPILNATNSKITTDFCGLGNVDLNSSDVTFRKGNIGGRYIQMGGNTSFDGVSVRSFILYPYGNNVFSNCKFSSGTRADNLKEDMDFYNGLCDRSFIVSYDSKTGTAQVKPARKETSQGNNVKDSAWELQL